MDGTLRVLDYLGEQERFWMQRADERMDLLRECREAILEVLNCPDALVRDVRGPLTSILRKLP